MYCEIRFYRCGGMGQGRIASGQFHPIVERLAQI